MPVLQDVQCRGRCAISTLAAQWPDGARLHMHAQGGSERMSDDAVEEMLDKVVRLLAYISDKARAPGSVPCALRCVGGTARKGSSSMHFCKLQLMVIKL